MTELKTFATLFLMTFAAHANTLKGTLDLTKLYGNHSAGQYDIQVSMDLNRTATVEVTQSLSQPPGSDFPGDLPDVCLTELKVRIGNITVELSDKNKDDHYNQKLSSEVVAYHFDETETCSTPNEILKNSNYFSSHHNLSALKLNYKAPYDYDALFVQMTVYPFGSYVRLDVETNERGELVISNLNQQLSSQIQRGYKNDVVFHVYAEKDSSTLSLGHGYITLW